MTSLIEGLPDDITLRCLAFVPFYLHPQLELVSKSWRAVIRSGQIFKVREEVGSLEDLLFVCCYDDDNKWQFFDPLRDLWITLPRLPSTTKSEFSVVCISQKLFVLGGTFTDPLNPTSEESEDPACNEVWSFDPITRNWSMQAPMPESRFLFACAVLDGKIIVVGGMDMKGEPTYKVEMYDPVMDLWVSLPDLIVAYESYLGCFAAVVGTKMHFVYNGTPLVQTYDSLERTWTVEDYGWFCDMTAVVPFQDSIYIMSHGSLYSTQDGLDFKFFVKVHEFQCRDRARTVCFRGKLYVIGGVVYSEGDDYENTSEVNVLIPGSKNQPMFLGTPMSRGCGVVLGCGELRF